MIRTLLAASTTALTIGVASATTPQLTIYSGDYDAVVQSASDPGGPGYALYQSPLVLNLTGQAQPVSRGGLPLALDANSLQLRPRGAARVLGQRFDFALAGEEELLRRSLGHTVSVEQDAGTGIERHTGELLAAGNGLTLRLDDGRIKRLAHYNSFELASLPTGMVSEPTVNWLVTGTGTQTFDLSYATAGLAWRAEYQAVVRGTGNRCQMQLDGAAMVANRSGADFDAVALTLIAGEPNRVASGGPELAAMSIAAAPRAKMVTADAGMTAQASGEYQAYRLPGTGSLPQGSIQRLPLLDAAPNVACERRYETGAGNTPWQPPYPIIDKNFSQGEGEQPVRAMLAFDNRKRDGLGVPLPAGRLRVFDGSEFLGEASLAHTAVDRPIDVAVGMAFDLSAKRTRTDFRLDRDGRQMQETIEIVLRNAKASAVTVQVLETLARWSDWEIIASSTPHQKVEAHRARFDVNVPANGETTLSYTVRYRWAADVKLP